MNPFSSMKMFGISILFTFVSFAGLAKEANQDQANENILEERTASIEQAVGNPFAISQHRRNYILPLSYSSNPNTRGVNGLNDENVDRLETKYQLSMKLPVWLPQKEDASGLYLGFTAVSYWQVYNSSVSKPFRETNYEPEVFYSWNSEFEFAGFVFNQAQVGFNHQSNGQSGFRSRGWNRLFASITFSDEQAFYYLKGWYRIKEDPKNDPLDAMGDDNPDITNFLGHAELGYGLKLGKFNLLTKLRNNFKTGDNKGSVELNLSYPVNDRYDVLLQYFNGYGESLIDYNRHQQRIGLGIQLKYL